MSKPRYDALRWPVAAVVLVLPAVLLLSSIRSLREIEETKAAYLRNRAVTVAARLESMDAAGPARDLTRALAVEEPALAALEIYRSEQQAAGDEYAASLLRGEALFYTVDTEVDGAPALRAYLPFHCGSALCVARIDLDREAADYLVENSRRHVWLSLLASAALVAFTGYFLWSERRSAVLQRRRLELEHLAELGRMAATLAHEIRNPLGTIKGFVQLALEQSGQDLKPMLDPVLEETQRLERLVNHLLLYGRPASPRKRRVEWRELAARLEAHTAQRTNGRPRFEVSGDPGPLETDPELLTQVLLNLVLNSIDALGEKPDGLVRVKAERRPRGGVRIVVEDNGPGIPEEIRGRLFEPFTTTKANGAGLGLSIARKLTEALGGRIAIESVAPHGTRVMLDFPE